MSRKEREKEKRRRHERDEREEKISISSSAMRGAAAILLFAVAGFLTLAAIGAAGVVGAKTYSLLARVFGIGATIVPSRGGLLGHLISDPLVAAVDTIATLVFLIAFTIVSLIIAFDIHLTAVVAARERLRNVKKDDENSMENVPILTLPSDESEGAESEGVAEEALKGARGE